MSFNQYLKDTQVELKHVAWPTQIQTIVYTVLVVGISITIALYIGFFDFLLTRGLERVIGSMGHPSSITTTPEEPKTPNVDFNVLPGTQNGTQSMPTITNTENPPTPTEKSPKTQPQAQ